MRKEAWAGEGEGHGWKGGEPLKELLVDAPGGWPGVCGCCAVHVMREQGAKGWNGNFGMVAELGQL